MFALVLAVRPMDREASEADLALSIAADTGDREAAEAALCRRFAPRIELYGLKHLGSRTAAQDLIQEVLLRVLQALRSGRVESPENLGSFVLGTCRNVTWDKRRTEQRQRKLADENSKLEAPVEPPSLTESDVVRLAGCMSRLPEREEMVIRMSFWEDQPADQIGGRLGLSAGNVRVLRHRALVKLTACLHRTVTS